MSNTDRVLPVGRLSVVVGMFIGTLPVQLPALAADGGTVPPAARRVVDFVKEIQPLFREKCVKCHGAARHEAGFRLDQRDDALNGGDSGPAFTVGKSEQSLLIKYVAGVDPDVLMPPEGDRLSDEQIGLLRAWIDQGAKWPADK